MKELWSDLRLFCYWKFLKGKPLLWGEFLYYLPPGDAWSWTAGWHYHVHTDRWTLLRLLRRGFEVLKLSLYNGYVYVLCRRRTAA